MQKFYTLSLVVPVILIIGCSNQNKKDYQVHVESTRENSPDSIVYLSDSGVRITVAWKSYKPKVGTVTLFDGSANPVLSGQYPTPFDDMIPDITARTIQYDFRPGDKSGNWRLVMNFENEEVVNYTFTVLPPASNPEAYQQLDCTTAEGKVALANLYQLSNSEIDGLKEYRGVWSWSAAFYELKKRVTLCRASELNAYQMDEWEHWLQQLTGQKVRQFKPTVHERIAEVMPAYEEEFLFVNPGFIEWFSANMVPDPKATQVNNWVYQEIYDRSVRDAARNLALTYLYYNSLPAEGLDAQVQYAEMMARKYINKEEERVMTRNDQPDVYKYISEWHEAAANEWVSNHIGKEIFGQVPYFMNTTDMGFWLRRGIDGSAYTVWMALRDVLKVYDTYWYEQTIDPHWAP